MFFAGLIAWGASLGTIVLAHGDLSPFGRDRGFAVTTSSIFLGTTVGGLLWAAIKGRALLTPMVVALGIWIAFFFACGLPPYILGIFGAPAEMTLRKTGQANGYSDEWIEKALLGPAMSAASGYMVDVYLWELLAEIRGKQQ